VDLIEGDEAISGCELRAPGVARRAVSPSTPTAVAVDLPGADLRRATGAEAAVSAPVQMTAPRASRGWRGSSSKIALTLVAAIVTVVFAYLAVRDVRFHEVWTALRTSNYWWLAPALATLALSFWIRVLRWRMLFSPETRPPLGATTRALLVCFFFNNVMPARAGEAIRVLALYQRAGTSRVETAGTVVTERAYDVLSVLFLLFVATPWLPHVSWFRAAVALAIAMTGGVTAVIVALAVWGDRPLRGCLRLAGRLPFVSVSQVESVVASLVDGLAALRRPRLAVPAFALSVLAWIVGGISSWFVMLEFDLGLSPVAGMLVQIAIGLALILPSSPAAVGVFEAAAVISLGAYKISDSHALSYALVLHAINFFPFLLAAPLVVDVRRRSRSARVAAPQPVSGA